MLPGHHLGASAFLQQLSAGCEGQSPDLQTSQVEVQWQIPNGQSVEQEARKCDVLERFKGCLAESNKAFDEDISVGLVTESETAHLSDRDCFQAALPGAPKLQLQMLLFPQWPGIGRSILPQGGSPLSSIIFKMFSF